MLKMSTAKITVTTDALPIKFGQAFILPDWAHPVVADDKGAPNNGFIFRNTPPAAAVIYEMAQGKSTPVYITPEAILPPNSAESLTPLISVAVWFQRDVSTGTMIDSASVQPFMVPMTTTTMTVEYNVDGKWVVISEFIDNTRGKYKQRMDIEAGQGQADRNKGDPAAQEVFPQKALTYRSWSVVAVARCATSEVVS